MVTHRPIAGMPAGLQFTDPQSPRTEGQRTIDVLLDGYGGRDENFSLDINRLRQKHADLRHAESVLTKVAGGRF
ncbi:PREDICTED: uncharacterized protein LOC105447877 [Wasmannia auropunctata]|uniref:uncharacterized protein LOC105447877 n=1 Tax=Wasmannia auropunctata TaxID=64793 RepID=UPI0005EF431D|nr:PREDICTED: uncharacterized protein LOC105447877 [Wasmannia auropunctata]